VIDDDDAPLAADVAALLDRAAAHTREGDDRAALRAYEAANRAGVPAAHRRRFLVGYGAALRAVGRVDDAVGLLAQAVVDDPTYPAHAAFLALALLDAGHPRVALATMLGAALDAARPEAFDGHAHALAAEHQALLAPAPE
jgi:tetratricopeptide (TPR) repeat protein